MADQIYTVEQINSVIRDEIENRFSDGEIRVRGEISNFKPHSSGHLYFSVKDKTSVIKCVMFRSYAARLKFRPEDGMQVVLSCNVSVYVPGGVYQLYVHDMFADGVGDLYVAFEQLKKKLDAEGLFSEYHKKKLPEYPHSLGVITSPTGAAVRDIINIAKRRFPYSEIVIYPSLVQGDGAEDNLCRGIRYFNSSGRVDVIIIGRGGGSIEDLWAFNGENLARCIYASEIPVISAVGHQTDYTICDYVADMRAPTPSAAAELALPDACEVRDSLEKTLMRCKNLLISGVSGKKEILNGFLHRGPFANYKSFFDNKRFPLSVVEHNLEHAVKNLHKHRSETLAVCAGKLNALSPLSVLCRGYSVVSYPNGRPARYESISEKDELTVTMHGGKMLVNVEKKYTEG